jgi:hypothetical protein
MPWAFSMNRYHNKKIYVNPLFWLDRTCAPNAASSNVVHLILFVSTSVADPYNFCSDPDPTFQLCLVQIRSRFHIWILAHENFVQTFCNTKFFDQKLHLKLIFDIKVNKHVFLSIHKTFQHKKRAKLCQFL